MDEFVVPARVEPAPQANLTDFVFDNAVEAPDAVVFARRENGTWRDVTAKAFLAEVVQTAKGLIAAGIEPGDRVALMSRTRYEWTLCDLAIWCAGAVTVPVYDTASAEQVQWILTDSGAKAALVETAEHAQTVRHGLENLDALAFLWVLDDGAVPALALSGEGVPDEEIARRRATLGADSLATIIYTSGTTGRPKGCELTHGNLRAEVDNAVAHIDEVFQGEPATLLFLPLAHVLARAVALMCVKARVRVGHTPNVADLLDDLASFHPTFLLVVPRVFEKVYNNAEQKAAAAGKARIFAAAARTAEAYSRALDAGRPGLALRVRHQIFDRLVYRKLQAALGGQVRFAVSGGAPLGARLGHFYRGIGLTVLEGYGLTETTAACCVNSPKHVKIGTVGPPLPGAGVRIAPDGEILVKGEVVFSRYYANPQATAEAFTADGWFRTGDLGALDDEGFLHVTGRKKELLVTAGGKNVVPTVLEDRIRAHPLVSQCVVVGDAKPYIGALLTLDAEALPGWLKSHGRSERAVQELSIQELSGDPDILQALQSAVDEANRSVSRAESIRRFRVLAVDFTEESGHLTPKRSIKRSVVLKDFAAEVDALYS